jgi:hypothetical protein
MRSEEDINAQVNKDESELPTNILDTTTEEQVFEKNISSLDDSISYPNPEVVLTQEQVNTLLDKDGTQNEATLMKLLNLEEDLDKDKMEPVPLQKDEVPLSSNQEASLQPTSITDTKDSSLVSVARYSMQYGPPSDSSALTVSLVSADQKLEELKEEEAQEHNSVTFQYQDQEMVSPGIPIGESWHKFELPGQSGSLCENNEYLCFCDNRENVFYSESIGTNLSWKRTDFKAIFVSTSSCGRIVWRLHRHTAYCLIRANTTDLFGGKWVKICENVASLWVGEATGWLVKLDGGLVCHERLSPECPHSAHPRQIYTGLFLTCVREHAGSLVALTGQASGLVQCSLEDLTAESSWSAICCVLPAVSVFSIGPGGELWAADSQAHIFFSTDWHSSAQPHTTWAQLSLQLPEDAEVAALPGGVLSPALCKPVLCPGISRLWVAHPLASHLLSNPYLLSGYRWSKLAFSAHSEQFSLSSVFCGSRDAYSGYILLTQNPQHRATAILWSTIHDRALMPLALPPGAVLQDISAVPGHMWLLTLRGSIYIRAGISSSQPVGTAWVKLSLGQLAGHRLLSVSIGTEQAWAVDEEGGVYLRLGSLLPPPGHASPAWLPVDQDQARVVEGAQLVQVVSSLQGDMVWARDSNYGVYVREAVYPELPVGTGWVPVTGISVVSLAISRRTVWALSTSGQVFRRRGISSTDWVGESWQVIPAPEGQAVSLSVGQCDTVWAVDKAGSLHQLAVTDLADMQRGEEDWTMVE